MTITATYPDYKTVSVECDAWMEKLIVESFIEVGALYTTVEQ